MAEVDIEDRGVRVMDLEQALSRGGVRCHERDEPCRLKHVSEENPGHRVVLDHEDHPGIGLDLIH